MFAVSSALYAVSRTLPGLILVRGVHGCGMGLYPTGGMAMAADLAPPARRGYVMGLVGIAANVALRSAGGGLFIVDRWGFGWLFAASTGMALIALVLALGQRETLAAPVRVPLALGSAFSRFAFYPCAIVLCLMTTYGVQSTFLPLYATSRGSHAGVFFTVMACAIILSRGIGGGLSDRVGRAPVAAVGTACVTAAMESSRWGADPARWWSPAFSTGSVSAPPSRRSSRGASISRRRTSEARSWEPSTPRSSWVSRPARSAPASWSRRRATPRSSSRARGSRWRRAAWHSARSDARPRLATDSGEDSLLAILARIGRRAPGELARVVPVAGRP